MKKLRKYRLTIFGRLTIFLVFVSPLAYYFAQSPDGKKLLNRMAAMESSLPIQATTISDSSLTKISTLSSNERHFTKVQVNTDGQSSSLNLRTAPNLDADIITRIPHHSIAYLISYSGEEIIINNRKGYWSEIIYAGTYRGYVFGGYLDIVQ